METVVIERLPRFQLGEQPHNTVAFDHSFVAIRLVDHPFAPLDGDSLFRIIVNGDEVGEAVRPILWRGHVRLVNSPIHNHF